MSGMDSYSSGGSVLLDDPAFTSNSGKRLHPRVEVPMTVEIAKISYTAEDWSLGGFAVSGGVPENPGQRLYKVICHVAGPSLTTSIETEVTPARVEAGRILSFRFINLTADQKRVLAQLSENWLSGVDGAYAAGAAPYGWQGAAPSSPRAVSTAASSGHGSGPSNGVRFFSALVLTLLVAAALYYLVRHVIDYMLTIKSDSAIVVGSVNSVRALDTGYVTLNSVRVGSLVAPGEQIGLIKPLNPADVRPAPSPINEGAELARQRQLVTLRADLAARQSDLEAAKTAQADYLTVLQNRLNDLASRLALQQDELAKAQVLQQRAPHRAAMRYYDDALSVETEASLVLLRTQRQVGDTQAQIRELQDRIHSVEAGQLAPEGRPANMTVNDIDREIRSMLAKVTDLEAQKQVALPAKPAPAGTPILSPCSCIVTSINVEANQAATRGQVLVNLVERGRKSLEVEAAVDTDRIAQLSLNLPVAIHADGLDVPVMGRITALPYVNTDERRLSLPLSADRNGKARRVLITVASWPSGVRQPIIGEAVSISVPIAASRAVEGYTGLKLPFLDLLFAPHVVALDGSPAGQAG